MMEEANKESQIGARGLLLNPTFAGGSSLEPSSEMRGGLFNIETDSVYTVRYRLRRKFPKGMLPL